MAARWHHTLADPAASVLSRRGIVQTLVPHDIIGRLMIQCSRQAHLAEVYDSLCGFDGCELYLKGWPSLTGKAWREVALLFDDACPLGLLQAPRCDETPSPSAPSPRRTWRAFRPHVPPHVPPHEPPGDVSKPISEPTSKPVPPTHANGDGVGSIPGTILLNPPDDYVLKPDDKVIVIAEDDDTYSPRVTEASTEASTEGRHGARHPNLRLRTDLRLQASLEASKMNEAWRAWRAWREPCKMNDNVLLLGWRRDLFDMLHELDKYLSVGSIVCVLAPIELEQREGLA